MSDSNGKSNIFVRIAVIAGMLLILFFIAAAIVKYVPRMISAMSPANVSLTSLFNPGESATSTPPANTNADNPTPVNPTPAPTYATSSAPAPTQTQTTTPAPKPTVPSTGGGYTYTYPTYTGPSDLAISLVKVGQIMNDGSYVQTSSLTPGSRVQVQFNISNVGSGRSGNWNLNAVLPTSIPSEKVYNSQIQPALNPGSSYLMTLAFDAYDPSQANIQIAIVASTDANSSNNILLIPVSSNGGGNSSNNCYWSGNTYYCNNNNSNNNCYYLNGVYTCTTGNTGSSDLSITIINVGTMDRNSGQFYFTNSISRSDKVAVQFEVKNLGGQSSGSFTFNASIPTSSNSSYSSNTQNSLAPGQTQSFTLGFDNPNTGSQSISLQLYPQGTDTNSSNNYASRQIQINN